jgi:cytochrome bd-type quinol oxidase subunit 2
VKRIGRGSAEDIHEESRRMVTLTMLVTGASGLLILASVVATHAGLAQGRLPRLPPLFLIDAAILSALLVGLHRRSRIAALTLFAYFLASRVWLWISQPDYVADSKVIMFDLLAIGAAFFGIVGAFKHHGELRRHRDGSRRASAA